MSMERSETSEETHQPLTNPFVTLLPVQLNPLDQLQADIDVGEQEGLGADTDA